MATNLTKNETTTNATAAPPPPKPLRFVQHQGQPPSKRRRINAACLTCRRRKIRCAGERPVCTTCTKYGHKCLGYPEEKEKKNGGEGTESRQDNTNDQDIDSLSEEENRAKKPRVAVDAKCRPQEHVTKHARHNSSSQNPKSTSTTKTKLTKTASVSPEPPSIVVPTSPRIANSHQAPTPSPFHSNVDDSESPNLYRNPANSHRVPFFRYFGPTAIVPGYKQMVVSVRDRRRSVNGSHSGTSPMSNLSGAVGSTSGAGESDIIEEPPIYDPNDPGPVHSLTLSLSQSFFVHMGCNYPFLNERKFMRMLKEKRVEPILVDAVCALAARFCDSPLLTGGNEKMSRTERGQVFAQRAKQATVDTFPCPTVAAVQACLLMAYEGFGANQDSALWMYLGLAIRMAVDLGLQKQAGTLHQGEKGQGRIGNSKSPRLGSSQLDSASSEEQKEFEQERVDTFWTIFVLDRVISSGTGRPVTLRDDDFELLFPQAHLDSKTQWPTPFPVLLEIIHLYGRVCDVLNKIHGASDLTQEKWQKLMALEHRLTKVYKSWDTRLQFNVINFKAYLGIGQGTTFILLHFWFHALFIILHQPTLMTPFGELRTEFQLLADSRELSMSSAKTICDILSFADLIDPKSFVGNPFTSQPIYIAACAFLMESTASTSTSTSNRTSRGASPPLKEQTGDSTSTTTIKDKKSRHSLLASAASQNYQRCHSSLEHLQTYWGGVKYILTALDQKSKGIWDCETFTSEEYESTKLPRSSSFGGQLKFEHPTSSPRINGPPIAWSLAGTTNSPSSSMTFMYQNVNSTASGSRNISQNMHKPLVTPPANMIEDPMRQAAASMFPSPFPQPNTSAVRETPLQSHHRVQNLMRQSGIQDPDRASMFIPPNYTSPNTTFEGYTSPPPPAPRQEPATSNANGPSNSYSHALPYVPTWGNNADGLTFDSQDIDIGALGLQQPELMGGWLDYIPDDVLGLFDHHDLETGGGH